jgi:hypothetical protein
MSATPDNDADEYVELVPIPLDQTCIAGLARLERITGEPAAKMAGRFLRQAVEELSRVRPSDCGKLN